MFGLLVWFHDIKSYNSFSFYMTFQNLITLQTDSESTKQGTLHKLMEKLILGINILGAQKPNPNLTCVWGTHVAA